MNKIEKTESLNLSLLLEVTESVLNSEGYENIATKEENLLTAKMARGFTTTDVGIYLTTEHLSGQDVNLEAIKSEIESYSKKFKFFDIIFISTKTISKGYKSKLNSELELNISYIDRDDLIKLIDEKLENYWAHNDMELLEYEKYYINDISKENELRSLRAYEKEAERLLNIYVKPRLYKIQEDKESAQHQLVKFEDSKILEINDPAIITGDTGAGKSTFLRKIGEKCIKTPVDGKKRLPVFISTVDLIEAKYDIEEAINKNLNGFFNGNWKEAYKTHNILLLVDSIDEFEKKIQRKILKRLELFFEESSIQYFLATRSLETNQFEFSSKKIEYFQLEKFDSKQVQAFVSKFFNNESRAQELIEALKANRILERLPMTPLSISLISILFEEKNFEIPATISDIYDNFNLLLLGKANVAHRFEFVDISFKERILSLYALEIMSKENKIPFTKQEFLEYFKDYFSQKSHPIPDGKIEEFLDFFVSNTGVLYLKDQRYVQFKHDSFMEYYTALEIFKHRRDLEEKLIDSFYDMNWQNSAIFYGGKSRDMPAFLKRITAKVQKGENLMEYNIGVMGLGYLLQALYQTDNNLRRDAILVSLIKNLDAFDTYKKIASDKELVPFKDLKLPFLSLINMFFFFENFNSATLREPLKMSFIEIFKEYNKNPTDLNSGYKSLKLALTLNSKRIGSDKELEDLIFKSNLLSDHYLALLADMGVNLFRGDNYDKLKKETRKAINKSSEVIRKLLDEPANSIRFTPMDQITSDKKIRIFTEGKTDAEIIEHAFIKLTNGANPYWSIQPTGDKDGGATELRFMLEKSIPMVKNDEIIIGVFDNDFAGISAFNGLKKHLFDYWAESKRIKKHTSKNVYALKLPIPFSRENYHHEDPNFNYFSIEHYFPDDLLKEEGLLIDTPLKGIYKIKDTKSAKSKFSSLIRTKHDIKIFSEFKILFKEIDKISKVTEVEYQDY